MTDLPRSQTRGFLFADLRDYTSYVERHGDIAAAELLGAYRSIVRAVVATSGGAEIRTEGDSFYVVFPSASAAVQGGLAILAAVAERNAAAAAGGDAATIRVGIGVHAGETAETAEGQVGSAVNIAARVCSQARAGELLVTDTVRSLTRTLVTARFEPRGTRRLKGIEEPIALYAVHAGAAGAAGALLPRARARSGTSKLRAPVLVIVAAAALVGAVAVGAVLFRPGTGPGTTAPPDSGSPGTASSGVASPSVGVIATSPVSPSGDTYPNVLEADLLSRMPDTVLRGTCRRADPAEAAAKATASIRCDLTGTTGGAPTDGAAWVIYDRFGSVAQMQNFVIGVQDGYRLAKGTCRQQPSAWQQWSFGGFQGKLLCFQDSDGHAGVLWSYESSNIAARGGRTDAQSDLLYAWWTETSALMVR